MAYMIITVRSHIPSMRDRASAEDALKDADIVLSAKSLLLNPDWVEDIRAGKSLPLHKSEDADIAYSDTPLL